MKTAALLLALSATAGLAFVGLAPEKKPAIQIPERPTQPAAPATELPKPEAPVALSAAAVGPPARADLVPVRAARPQPGLPGQVTLTVANGLPGGLALNAAPIGLRGYTGWAGFDSARNCTHLVFFERPIPTMAGSWVYGVVLGNGVPADPPAGCTMTLGLRSAVQSAYPQRPPASWFDPTWVPPPPVPTPTLPLVGGNLMVPRPELPYGGAVVVQ